MQCVLHETTQPLESRIEDLELRFRGKGSCCSGQPKHVLLLNKREE